MTTADHSGARAAGSTVRAAAPPGAGTIYVLAPVHNRRAITERFVRCLAAQTDQGFHLVLVDDGSKDGTADAVSSIIPSATILRGTGHWWWAGSLEQARRWLLQQPSGPDDLVLIANDDTSFAADFLAAARAAMARAPRSLLLARPIRAENGEPGALGATVNWRKLQFKPALAPEDVDVFPTRGLFLRRDDFIDLGGFHTVLLPHYLSDYEFTLRAARRDSSCGRTRTCTWSWMTPRPASGRSICHPPAHTCGRCSRSRRPRTRSTGARSSSSRRHGG